MKTFLDGKVVLHGGDAMAVVRGLADNSIDSVCTDPPYALVSITKRFGKDGAAPAKGDHAGGAYARASSGFMGKIWDTGETAFAVEFWAEILRVLKPGGHVAAFGGTRSYHRLACAIEDAGFEIRDQLAWCYGTGFPKSHDVSKGIDKAAGAERTEAVGKSARHGGGIVGNGTSYEVSPDVPMLYAPATDAARQWEGWGTALKPAWEPICLGRKPLSEKTVAANVLRWGCGAINVGACKVLGAKPDTTRGAGEREGWGMQAQGRIVDDGLGRFPANLCHDGSDEVLDLFPDSKGQLARARTDGAAEHNSVYGALSHFTTNPEPRGDSGSAARFFASFPIEDESWLDQDQQTLIANDAGSHFTLSSERAVSALRSAVEQSTQRLELKNISFQERNMSVSGRQFASVETLLTEMIQNIERRYLQGPPLERLTLLDSLASIAATQNRTGIITITISLSTLNGSVDVATFNLTETNSEHGGEVSAERFHYSAKASKKDRAGARHPTVKPVKLMQWLVRLITPPGGTTLDPFSGTGTTGEAAWREGFSAVLIEREEEYQADIERRMLFAKARPKDEKKAKPAVVAADEVDTLDLLPLCALPLAPEVACQATMAAE